MKFFSLVLFMLITGLAKAQPEADIIDYINKYKQLAMEEEQRSGVPAAIKLAQGIHETMAGKSDLVLASNNHFGIKCKSIWTGAKVYHDDDARGECFRKYAQAADSYRDHSDFLRGSDRYDFLFKLDPTDYKGWAFGLKRAGYATNPKYAPIIIKLIETYNLEQYTLIAIGKMAPGEEIVLQSPRPATNLPLPVITVADTAEASAQPPVEAPVETAAAGSVVNTDYPEGEFTIDNIRAIFAKKGTVLLSVAQQYDIPLGRLLDLNDLGGRETLDKDQVLFLQKKRKAKDSRQKL